MSWVESHDIVRIEFPDGAVKRFGTGKMDNVPLLIHTDLGMVTDTGNYLAHLLQSSSTRQTLTQAADKVTVSIQNVDRAIGLTINNVATSLVGASAVFAKVFKDPNTGLWKSSPLCYGEIADVKINESTAGVTIVSDTAPNVRFLTNRPVAKTCPLAFKGVACGYSGPLTTCNKKRDDPDGCSGRDNVHRFGGFVAEGELTEPVVGSGFGTPTRDGDGDLIPPGDRRFRLPDQFVQN